MVTVMSMIGGGDSGGLQEPIDVAIDGDGDVYDRGRRLRRTTGAY